MLCIPSVSVTSHISNALRCSKNAEFEVFHFFVKHLNNIQMHIAICVIKIYRCVDSDVLHSIECGSILRTLLKLLLQFICLEAH